MLIMHFKITNNRIADIQSIGFVCFDFLEKEG